MEEVQLKLAQYIFFFFFLSVNCFLTFEETWLQPLLPGRFRFCSSSGLAAKPCGMPLN